MHFAIEALERRELFDAGPVVASFRTVLPSPDFRDSSSISFFVRYRDGNGVDSTSFDSRDLRITGPNGFVRYARAVSSNSNTLGSERTVTYKIPGITQAGEYTVRLRAGEVFDLNGNAASARLLGTFTIPAATTGDMFNRAAHVGHRPLGDASDLSDLLA